MKKSGFRGEESENFTQSMWKPKS